MDLRSKVAADTPNGSPISEWISEWISDLRMDLRMDLRSKVAADTPKESEEDVGELPPPPVCVTAAASENAEMVSNG
jgi:hypothetical protein